MKKELINDVLTGLLVSAAFSAVAPAGVMAANLADVATTASSSVGAPFVTIVSYISYGLGTVMTVAGIAGAKKHADNPSANPLNPALGKLGAGAAFLAAPSVVKTLQDTGSETLGGPGATATTIGF